eukprot:TRINITY_DN18714_c0_g2_i1.p1 TRINITY_DN18714_c0_g2~~TRINITY_DN18714_c0_g2_i1.p1  ORF type:complete len:324 (-),score=30.76 TRINITY_DN18714_c0_g2_i1:93-1064(-)
MCIRDRLHTSGYECFAPREQQVWVAGSLLHFAKSTEAECRSSCAEGAHSILYVRHTSECYCHRGVGARGLKCGTRDAYCNATTANCTANTNATDCVSYVRTMCFGYEGFSLRGIPGANGNLGPSEFESRARAPQLRSAAPRDWSRPSGRSQCGAYPTDRSRCRTASGDTHCPHTQLPDAAGWCGSSSKCPFSNGAVCNNQGTCTSQGLCNCLDGWFGQACESRVCPNDCLGHGTCDHSTGRCHCDCVTFGRVPCYSGEDCSTQHCPAVDGKICAGQGACIQGVCQCNPGYGGEDCSARFCGTGHTEEAARSPGSLQTLSLIHI